MGGDAEDGEMSSRDDQAANPYAASPAPSFHPEFGYLCPSAAFWRRARVAAKLVLGAMAVAAGAAFGLSSVLLVAPPVDQGKRAVPALVAQAPQDAQGSPIAPAPTPAPSAALAVTPSVPAALAHAQASCADPSLSFLSPQCQSVRKSRALRAAQEKRRPLATAPLGHVDAPPDTVPPPEAEVAHQAPPVPDKAKKPVKTAHKHHRSNPDIETVAVAPPPPPPGFGLFGFLHGF
jgi:hypothetical protein